MTRVAAIDCGTNSIRLLVSDIDGETKNDVERTMTIVRLGEGVDRTGVLSEAAMGRTFDALEDYQRRIRRHGVELVRMVATSATRDAANRDAFVEGVRARIGVDPEVVTGQEEANLSFRGATWGLSQQLAPGPRLVVDIGGGSTEVVLGEDDVIASASVDVGCVRVTERCFASDPPGRDEQEAAVGVIDVALDTAAAQVPLHRARSMIGLAGTVTTMAGIHLELDRYDPAAIHESVLPADACRRISAELLAEDHAARSARPVMHPGRVDVIAAGSMVLAQLVQRTGLDVVVSERDILDGIAWSVVAPNER